MVGVEHINATSTNHLASAKVVQVTSTSQIAVVSILLPYSVVGGTDLWATKITAGLGLVLCVSGAELVDGCQAV